MMLISGCFYGMFDDLCNLLGAYGYSVCFFVFALLRVSTPCACCSDCWYDGPDHLVSFIVMAGDCQEMNPRPTFLGGIF